MNIRPAPLLETVRRAFSAWGTRDKVHAVLLVLLAGAVVGHQAAFWHWYVEDSAISFAYARNLVQGEGLVAFPGGERVEGYSNPTWVLILAAMQLVGLDPFVWVKWLQLVIGVATVPAVYLSVREALGRDSDIPIVAVAFLAANSQFAIWGGAGLENGLLNLLIALGFLRMMVEIRPSAREPFPWSAAIWLLVALTRPEGILYSAVAGFCSLVFTLHARRSLRSTAAWLAVFFVPFGLYHAVHYWYFAWPLPNTYYAKLEDREGVRWVWEKVPGGKAPQAWNWTRNFFHEMGQGYFLPIWILGIVGDGRLRYVIATAAFLLVGGMIELSSDQRWLLPVVVGALWAAFWLGLRQTEEQPPRWLAVLATLIALALVGAAELLRSWHLQPNLLPVPGLVKIVPPYVLAALALLLPLVGYGSRGWQLRVLSWLFCCAVIVFAIYVQWDWMKGFRWYATAAVPGAILFAFGTDAFVRFVAEMFRWTAESRMRLQRIQRPRFEGLDAAAGAKFAAFLLMIPLSMLIRALPPTTLLAAVLVLLQLPANIQATRKIANAPDAAPRSIKSRVDYVDRVRDRLHIDERLVDLDVDQGAHLWWSDFEMMDIAGLVDLPRAHGGFEKSFIKEYVFEERRPHYAHVHGGWASNSKIPTHPEWRKDYIEIPGYPAGKTQLHPGNFVRRDLVVFPEWPHGGEPVLLQNGIRVYGPIVVSDPGVERKVYVEVGVSVVPPDADPDAPKEARVSPKERNFRMILFASDGTRFASWDLPPGYDWLKPEKWKEGEIFVGKFDLPLPAALEPGRYDLGVVVLSASGSVVSPAVPSPEPPRMAVGELLLPGALTVLSLEDRSNAAIEDRNAALAAAERLDCDEAERSWKLARHHRAGEEEWETQFHDEMRTAFATCWAKSADGHPRDEQVRRLIRAREWDWWNDEYRARAPSLAESLHAEGLVARESQAWEDAYRLFTQAVEVDRSRAWSRKYAEEARHYRLGIDPESMAKKEAEVAAKKAAADEARERRAAEAAKDEAAPEEAPEEGGEEEGAPAPPEGM